MELWIMTDPEKDILKTLHELDTPNGYIACTVLRQRLSEAIGMARLSTFASFSWKVQAELIAFQAVELPQGELRTISLSDSVPLKTVQAFLDYWSSRAKAARNCRLRERYAAIAIQVSGARGLKVKRFLIAKIQIRAAVEMAAECKPNAWSEAMPPLKCALRLALSLRHRDMATQVAEAMGTLAEKCWSAKTKEVNLWPQCFDAILVEQEGKLSISPGLRDKIITETEASFQVTLGSIKAGDVSEFKLARDYAKWLVDFYQREKRPDDIDRVVKSLQQAVLKGSETLSLNPGYISMFVPPVVKFLHDCGYPALADEVAAKIRILSKSLPGLLPERRFQMDIRMEDIRAALKRICVLETYAAIHRLALELMAFPPVPQGSASSISSFVGVQTGDDTGRVTSSSASAEEGAEIRAIYAYLSVLDAARPSIQYLFDETISRKGITAEVLADFCIGSRAFISVDRREVLRRGFAAWLQRDYAAAILFLLPQIERAVQNIVQAAGRSGVQLPKGNAAMDYKLLDGLLTDTAAKTVLGDDCTKYLRILLTDKRGWNIRNRVLHGWVDPCSLGRPKCDRVVHAALLLAAKTVDTEEPPTP